MLTHKKKIYTVSIVLLFSLLLAACGIGSSEALPVENERATTSQVNVHLFSDNETDVAGATSTLERRTDSIDLVLDTTGLTPGDAYTIWWVFFNNPAGCAEATCKGSDLSNPETVGMVGYATGAIADEMGNAHFMASLNVGDTSIALDNNDGFPVELVEPAPGLIDPDKAEIHAVVRTHGAALPDPTEQLTTFGGGCNPECANEQAAVHPPQVIAQK